MLFSLLPRFTFPGITDNAFYLFLNVVSAVDTDPVAQLHIPETFSPIHSCASPPPSPRYSISPVSKHGCQSFKTPIIDLFSKLESLRPSWRDV